MIIRSNGVRSNVVDPQTIFWGPNYTFLHSNKTKMFKKFLPCFTQHTFSILNWDIFAKNPKIFSSLTPLSIILDLYMIMDMLFKYVYTMPTKVCTSSLCLQHLADQPSSTQSSTTEIYRRIILQSVKNFIKLLFLVFQAENIPKTSKISNQ